MSDYKKGDKVLLEAEVVAKRDSSDHYEIRPKSTMDTVLVIGRYIHPATAAKTYEDGLRDAWETARRIDAVEEYGGLSLDELECIFDTTMIHEIFTKFTAAEAAAKISAWEDRKKIHVGDVVNISNLMAVVTNITNILPPAGTATILFSDGSSKQCPIDTDIMVKTGKHIDAKGFLEQIGGTQDEL